MSVRLCSFSNFKTYVSVLPLAVVTVALLLQASVPLFFFYIGL